MDGLQLLKQEEKRQNIQEQVQQEVPQQVQRPGYEKDFMKVKTNSSWVIMERDEVAISEIEAETRYLPSAVTEERKKKMKNMLKANSKIRNELSTTDISNLALWGQASKNVDGASAEFQRLSDTLYSFATSYNKYKSADNESKGAAEFEKNDEAVNMIKAAQKYIALHRKEKQFSDKGKNRMELAKYIVSRQFVTKYLVEDTIKRGNREYYLSNVYDADSFVFEHMYRKANILTSEFAKKEETRKITNKIVEKYSINGDVRRQIDVLFTADEKQNKKILDAMSRATGEQPDITGMYQVLDEKVNEMLKFKVTPEMFTKTYIKNNPAFLVHINALSMIVADFFGPNCIYEKIGAPYMESLRKNHPNVAEAFDAKTKLLADYGMSVATNTKGFFEVSQTIIRENVMTNSKTMVNARGYNPDREDYEPANPITLESFKNTIVKGKVEEKYYTTTFDFNRVKNRKRYDRIQGEELERNKIEYKSQLENNDAITEDSLKFMDYITVNDARLLLEFYVPHDGLFVDVLKSAMREDLKGDDDLDRCLAGMLKMVRFDNMGEPLPEYKENHKWNIYWIKSYAKAIAKPSERNPEYEKYLKEMTDWVTSEENIKRFETVCESKSYEKNPDDMTFMMRMSEISLKLFDNHIKKSTVAKPFYTELGEEREKIEAKMDYVSRLGAYTFLDLQTKYQINSGNYNKLMSEKMTEDSPIQVAFKTAYKNEMDKAREKYNKLK